MLEWILSSTALFVGGAVCALAVRWVGRWIGRQVTSIDRDIRGALGGEYDEQEAEAFKARQYAILDEQRAAKKTEQVKDEWRGFPVDEEANKLANKIIEEQRVKDNGELERQQREGGEL